MYLLLKHKRGDTYYVAPETRPLLLRCGSSGGAECQPTPDPHVDGTWYVVAGWYETLREAEDAMEEAQRARSALPTT